ncbi:TatD family hydrolase [Pedobacter sp. SYSU D00535]|uniref:TatD family hydrolase n=1 Tax=Pedobacter sp. SYSU D00535 TaxID=2810308 RepID=UPI001A97060F|nr:TatD family hydrolase [Pedobacter sp. SYSU D00535]
MYIDIHTHLKDPKPGVKAIANLIVGEDNFASSKGLIYSAGIHPWYIQLEHQELQLQNLRELLSMEKVVFLGECGLDRLKGPAFSIQLEVFKEQLLMAEEFKKPVIIHCVKSFSELVQIRQNLKLSIPLIVHGFNNNRQIAAQLLKYGFRLSFGAALLQENSNAAAMVKDIPEQSLFLETDDRDVSIEDVYQTAARLRNISLNRMRDIIFANWMSLKIEEEL